MNTDTLKGQWKQLKGAVKKQWGKLTDDDLETIDGTREQVVGKIQEKYGIAKDEAEKQYKQFEKENLKAQARAEVEDEEDANAPARGYR